MCESVFGEEFEGSCGFDMERFDIVVSVVGLYRSMDVVCWSCCGSKLNSMFLL